MTREKYVTFHVDIFGVAHASYELIAADDEAAKSEARNLLPRHPSLEIWQGSRFIYRLTRTETPRLRSH
jgi:hypothetical protein